MLTPSPAPAAPPPPPPAPTPHSSPSPLAEHLRTERALLAEFLATLAEFDRRRLWRELGYPTLLAYLMREVGLSATSAYQRKVAAELIQRFPEIEQAFRDGRLCLSRVVDLARALSGEDGTTALARFCR